MIRQILTPETNLHSTLPFDIESIDEDLDSDVLDSNVCTLHYVHRIYQAIGRILVVS
jgi:hypothetical protein